MKTGKTGEAEHDYDQREMGVMFANNNMLFVMLNGKADALGDLTATNTSTKTFAGAGIAGGHAAGLAVATSFAEGTTAAAPSTGATTDWLGFGGYNLISSHSNNVSFDLPHGPTPVSLSISSTSVTLWGFLSASPFDYGR